MRRPRPPVLPLRSKGLLLIATIWFTVGIGSYTPPITPIDSAWHYQLPPALVVSIWWTAAFGAIGAAVDKQDGRRDWLALVMCTLPPMLHLTSFATAWIIYLIPGGQPGYARGWMTVALYACMVALVWLVAAIPDGQDRDE